jgi:anionic cell wall polymer biosynthesis LytR-Cps2A-Psr (LCP) family protein
MTQNRHSIDGFVPRRPGSQLGDRHVGASNDEKEKAAAPAYRPTGLLPSDQSVIKRSELGIARTDLDDSLKGIDNPDESKKDKKRRKKGAPKSKARRIVKRVIIVLVILLIAGGGWFAYKALHAGGNIFKGNVFDLIQNQPLKQDANGRSNILILGTSQDDPGHEAGYLTDSIMVMSIDQKNKNIYMVSIPRDLEVQYGESCISGNRGKINVYFNCVGGGTDDVEADRTALTKEAGFIGQILGMDIQYGVNVNYTVMRELVGAVGGITVTIESRDPRGQMDSNFDWKCGVGDRKVSRAEVLRRCPPSGHYIDYPNGPVNLDAEHALYLAQARGDSAPTYGFEQSNFDREKNQQKIVKAIREKATSAGVLADFGKVSNIIDALGNNLRTTFAANEFRTLVDLAKDIKDKDIQSISLVDGDHPVMNGNAQPAAGMYQYGEIQALIKKKLSSNPVTREEANVIVLNGAGVAGVAKTEADKLTAQGFVISGMDNAPDGTYGDVEVYQIKGTDKPATKAKLQSIYGVKVKTTDPPIAVDAGTNFVVIIGKDRSASSN